MAALENCLRTLDQLNAGSDPAAITVMEGAVDEFARMQDTDERKVVALGALIHALRERQDKGAAEPETVALAAAYADQQRRAYMGNP